MTLEESDLHCQSNVRLTIYSVSCYEYPNVILSSSKITNLEFVYSIIYWIQNDF